DRTLRLRARVSALRECRDAGDGATENERVDVVGAFVSIDGLEVDEMAHYLELSRDAVAAMHVAGGAGDVEGLAGVVALDERDGLRRQACGLEQAAGTECRL